MSIFNHKKEDKNDVFKASNKIDFDEINDKIKKIKDEDTAETMKAMLNAIWNLGNAFVKIVDKVDRLS